MDPADGEPAKPSSGMLARQSFKTLKTRWGVALDDLDWKKPPELIFVDVMGDYRETWKQWKPAGEPKKPDDVEFQLIETRKVTSGST